MLGEIDRPPFYPEHAGMRYLRYAPMADDPNKSFKTLWEALELLDMDRQWHVSEYEVMATQMILPTLSPDIRRVHKPHDQHVYPVFDGWSIESARRLAREEKSRRRGRRGPSAGDGSGVAPIHTRSAQHDLSLYIHFHTHGSNMTQTYVDALYMSGLHRLDMRGTLCAIHNTSSDTT
jgi:hypothetical protein